MEEDLKKNGGKMEDDLEKIKWKTTSNFIFLNGRRPQKKEKRKTTFKKK